MQKLDVDTELIVVKSNAPTRKCTAALAYPDLAEVHLVMVSGRSLYLSLSLTVPLRLGE